MNKLFWGIIPLIISIAYIVYMTQVEGSSRMDEDPVVEDCKLYSGSFDPPDMGGCILNTYLKSTSPDSPNGEVCCAILRGTTQTLTLDFSSIPGGYGVGTPIPGQEWTFYVETMTTCEVEEGQPRETSETFIWMSPTTTVVEFTVDVEFPVGWGCDCEVVVYIYILTREPGSPTTQESHPGAAYSWGCSTEKCVPKEPEEDE